MMVKKGGELSYRAFGPDELTMGNVPAEIPDNNECGSNCSFLQHSTIFGFWWVLVVTLHVMEK